MTDADNGQQTAFTNVFVLYASSGIKDDGYTRQYDMTGGTGLYLHGGAWEQISWSKEDATGPFSLTAADGTPLTVAPGKSFIAIWGGYYGQALRLTAADGASRPCPKSPSCWQAASLMKPLPPPGGRRCRTRRSSSTRRLPLTRPTPAWPRHRLNCRTPRPPWTPTARTPTCSPPAMPRRQKSTS